ncbi:Nucleolar protein 16 [Tilletia horrida]|uniref:Nucleolar protein 16 n=1 Tax=Tilletia horrida TaxID=155126 RepID=A0AAN6GS60_9BASI|nr:Nucleolar protein 16 [Tilletia horrida]KAK0548015.1 Nucleolar protein 16 [Tilletia horrida]KAK0563717.1 Nucleolar protein 16 [Tilletia horrida]
MANPRQRRKQRSSSASGSSNTSKRAQRKKLHRAPPIKGPAAAIIGDQWDPKKTIRQNYRALGLVGDSLALRPSGGGEQSVEEVVRRQQAQASKGKAKSASGERQDASDRPLRKGLGRIIRDADGNVVDIIEGGAEDEDDEDDGAQGEGASSSSGRRTKSTPWGKPFKEWDGIDQEAAPIDSQRSYLPDKVGPQTEAGAKVIASLEERAAQAAPVVRHTSSLEADWLRGLVRAHGDDIEAMARDRKLNLWQKTPGEIKRAIKKAGGKDALLA